MILKLRVLKMFSGLIGKVPASHLWYLFRRLKNEKPHTHNGQLRINTFFPPYPSKAFDRFCDAVAHKRRVPYSLYVATTEACPHACEHCSYAGRAKATPTKAQLLKLIDEVKAMGTSTMGFSGGEPLLRDDLPELIAAAQPEMTTVVFTTGHRLDSSRARDLANAGVGCVTIGLEGTTEQIHDAVRKTQGSFEQTRQAVMNCKEAGIYTAISTVGTRERIENGQLEGMYQLAKLWGVKEFRLLGPVPTGRKLGDHSFALKPHEQQKLFDFHIEKNRQRNNGPAVASFAYLESPEMFGCGAGYHHLFIDASGEICPCDLAPMSFGNAFSEKLSDVWKRMAAHFALPFRQCIMRQLRKPIPNSPLPTPPEQSQEIAPIRDINNPLPEVYRRLFKSPE